MDDEVSARRKRWPYAVALGVVAIGGAVAFVALRGDKTNPEAACDAITGPPTMSPGIAKVTAAPIRKTVEGQVSRYSTEWSRLARASCVAHARHELSDPVYATTTRCLERRAAAFKRALQWEAPETLPNVIESLEPIETCRVEQPTPVPAPKLLE